MGGCRSCRGLLIWGQGLALVKDDRGFADVALVDRLSAQGTLLPSILLLEVQVLQETRIAEKVAALGHPGRDHEPSRLHADWTLSLLT